MVGDQEPSRRSSPRRRSRSRPSVADYFSDIYKRPRGLSRTQRIVAIVAILVVTLLVADAIYVVLGLRNRLNDAAGALDRGKTQLREGELPAAAQSFREAEEAAASARELIGHPILWLAGNAPWINNDVEAMRSLPAAAGHISRAGVLAVESGVTLGGTTESELARALYRGGRVQLDVITDALPQLARVDQTLAKAQESLPEPKDLVIDQIEEALAGAREEVNDARETTTRGTALLRALPPLLGSEGRRRYLLAFQSPSESRGTGGVIGLYGVLEAADGTIRLTKVGPFPELFTNLDTSTITSLEALQDFLRRYEAALVEAADVNTSPDFAAVSKTLLRIYERATGKRLDGVLATDPVALSFLTKATGPIKGRGLETEIGPENAVEVLLRDAYVEFADDPQAQSVFLNSVIADFYDRLGNAANPIEIVSGFGLASSSQHLKLYSRDPEEEKALGTLGLSGTLDSAGSNVQMLYHNNLAANKVDYFMERHIETTISISLDGYVSVKTVARISNGARRDGPKPLVESYSGTTPDGVNEMNLYFLLPRGASVRGGSDLEESVQSGLPAPFVHLKIPPQGTKRVVIEYEMRRAIDVLTGGDFEFTLFPHATVKPDTYEVTFVPPVGFRVMTEQRAVQIAAGSLRYSGVLDEPEKLEITVEPF